MWEGFIQPPGRVDLDAVDPHVPVQVCAGDAPGGADFSDQLTRRNVVAGEDRYFCLVIQAAVDSLAVVNDRGVAAHGLGTGKDDHTVGWRVDVEWMCLGTDAIIYPGMEPQECSAVI